MRPPNPIVLFGQDVEWLHDLAYVLRIRQPFAPLCTSDPEEAEAWLSAGPSAVFAVLVRRGPHAKRVLEAATYSMVPTIEARPRGVLGSPSFVAGQMVLAEDKLAIQDALHRAVLRKRGPKPGSVPRHVKRRGKRSARDLAVAA